MNNALFFKKLKSSILSLVIILFPFFFLPVTQEFFATNKFYLLALSALVLLLISLVQFFFSREIQLTINLTDILVLFFLITAGLSVSLSSPNKVQAILNPGWGLGTFLSLFIFYYYLKNSPLNLVKILRWLTLLLSFFTIFFLFHPFRFIQLPLFLSFLNDPNFTTLGNQLDLALFLGFLLVINIAQMPTMFSSSATKGSKKIFLLLYLALNALTFFASIILVFKSNLPLPSYRLSWFTSLETLKNPQTVLFGAGIDNFSSVFTKAKNSAYNQSPLWQISSFNLSRSTFLHLLTETGIFGFAAVILLFLAHLKAVFSTYQLLLFSFFLLTFAILPPSLPLFFLFFLALAINNEKKQQQLSLSFNQQPYIYLPLGGIFALTILVSFYLLVRSYAAEVKFKQSINAWLNQNIRDVYENQRQAAVLNPFIEKYRISFSQTNLFIAEKLAQKTAGKLSAKERLTVAQAVQSAISEAKAAVALNPQKAVNWENLAVIYRRVQNQVEGAQNWATAAYQRAILLDPQNPQLYLNLGGIYFAQGKFDEAIKFFNQAASLKPDWPNAYYNLGHSYLKKKDYPQAKKNLQKVINLLDPVKNKPDLEKTKKDLDSIATLESQLKSP